MNAGFQKFREYLNTPKAGTINELRHRRLLDAYEIIKPLILAEDPNATVDILEDALQLGSVFIRAITSDVTVYDTSAFSEAIKYADNFQVYPTADERVKLDILFEGVIDYTLL